VALPDKSFTGTVFQHFLAFKRCLRNIGEPPVLVCWVRHGCGCSSGVEHNLAKVGVEGSNPFARSKFHKLIQLVMAYHAGRLLLRKVFDACILSGFYAPGRKLWDTPSQARRHATRID
jgi:hypothetical protein